jgi:hypothetical protein
MKPDLIASPIEVDRAATPEEIRTAVLPLPDGPAGCGPDTAYEIASDLGGYVRISAEELESFRLVAKLLEDNEVLSS